MWKVVPLLVLLVAGPAVAGPQEDAEAAIARGVALRKVADDTGALEEFQRAHALFPSPRSQAQVGLAMQALGRWVEAEAHLTAALGAQEDPWIIKNRQTLQGAVDTVSARVGSLEVVGSPAGAQVIVEQRPVGVLPLPGPVRATAGTVALEVRAAGYLPVLRNVVVSSEALSRETVNLARGSNNLFPSETNTPSATRPPEDSSQAGPADPTIRHSAIPGRTTLTWITGIGAVALAAPGIAALVVRADKSEDLATRTNVRRTCTRMGDNFSGPDNVTCVNLASAKDRWTWVAICTLTAAGAAAATTAVLLATRPKVPEAGASTGTVVPRVAAALTPDGGFIAADWTF